MDISLDIKKRFTKAFWIELSENIIERIWDDAKQGKFQNGLSALKYKSESYKDYKSRYMQGKRLTRKIKPYDAVSVISNETKFVNMILTGGLKSAQTYETYSDNLGTKIYFDEKEKSNAEAILLGNESHGRVISALSKENQDYVFDEILSQVDEAIRKDFAKNITITL
jgi:phosphoribosylformylglycinamidine (FGAM) synthase-like enzyme